MTSIKKVKTKLNKIKRLDKHRNPQRQLEITRAYDGDLGVPEYDISTLDPDQGEQINREMLKAVDYLKANPKHSIQLIRMSPLAQVKDFDTKHHMVTVELLGEEREKSIKSGLRTRRMFSLVEFTRNNHIPIYLTDKNLIINVDSQVVEKTIEKTVSTGLKPKDVKKQLEKRRHEELKSVNELNKPIVNRIFDNIINELKL